MSQTSQQLMTIVKERPFPHEHLLRKLEERRCACTEPALLAVEGFVNIAVRSAFIACSEKGAPHCLLDLLQAL